MSLLDVLKGRLQNVGANDDSFDGGGSFAFKNQGKNWSGNENGFAGWENSDESYKDLFDKKDDHSFEAALVRAHQNRRRIESDASLEKAGESLGDAWGKFTGGDVLGGLGKVGEAAGRFGGSLLEMNAHMPQDIAVSAYEAATGRNIQGADEQGNVPEEKLNMAQRLASAGSGLLMGAGLGGQAYDVLSGAGRFAKAKSLGKMVESATTKEAARPFAEAGQEMLNKGWAANKKFGEAGRIGRQLAGNAAVSAGEGALFTALGNVREQGEFNIDHVMDNWENQVTDMAILTGVPRLFKTGMQAKAVRDLGRTIDNYNNMSDSQWREQHSSARTLRQNDVSNSANNKHNKFLNQTIRAYQDLAKEKAPVNSGMTTQDIPSSVQDSTLNNNTVKADISQHLIDEYHKDPNSFKTNVMGEQGEGGLSNYGTLTMDTKVNGDATFEDALKAKDNTSINNHLTYEQEVRKAQGQEPIKISVRNGNDGTQIRANLEIDPNSKTTKFSKDMYEPLDYNRDSANPVISLNKNNISNAEDYYKDTLNKAEDKKKYIEAANIGSNLADRHAQGYDIFENTQNIPENFKTRLIDLIERYNKDKESYNKNQVSSKWHNNIEKSFYNGITELIANTDNPQGIVYALDRGNRGVMQSEINESEKAKSLREQSKNINNKKNEETTSSRSTEYDRNNWSQAQLMLDDFSYVATTDENGELINSSDYNMCINELNKGNVDGAIRIMDRNQQLKELYYRAYLKRQFNINANEVSVLEAAKRKIQNLVTTRLLQDNELSYSGENGTRMLDLTSTDSMSGEEKSDMTYRKICQIFTEYADVVRQELKNAGFTDERIDSILPRYEEPKRRKDEKGFEYENKVAEEQKKTGIRIVASIVDTNVQGITIKTDSKIIDLNKEVNRVRSGIGLNDLSEAENTFIKDLVEQMHIRDMEKNRTITANLDANKNKFFDFFSTLRRRFRVGNADDTGIVHILNDERVSDTEKQAIVESVQDFGDMVASLVGRHNLHNYGIDTIGDLLERFPRLIRCGDKEELVQEINRMQLNIKVASDFRNFFVATDNVMTALDAFRNDPTNETALTQLLIGLQEAHETLQTMQAVNNNYNMVDKGLLSIAADYSNKIQEWFVQYENAYREAEREVERNGGEIQERQIAEQAFFNRSRFRLIEGFCTCLDAFRFNDTRESYNNLKDRITNASIEADYKNNTEYITSRENLFDLHLATPLGSQMCECYTEDRLRTIRNTTPEKNSDTYYIHSENKKTEFRQDVVETRYANNTSGLLRDTKTIMYRNLSRYQDAEIANNFIKANSFMFPQPEVDIAGAGQNRLKIMANAIHRIRQKISDRQIILGCTNSNITAVTTRQFRENLNFIKAHLLFEDNFFIRVKDERCVDSSTLTPADYYNTVVRPDTPLEKNARLTDEQKVEILQNDYSLLQELQPDAYGTIKDNNNTNPQRYKVNESFDSIYKNIGNEDAQDRLYNYFLTYSSTSENALDLRCYLAELSTTTTKEGNVKNENKTYGTAEEQYNELIKQIVDAAMYDYINGSTDGVSRLREEAARLIAGDHEDLTIEFGEDFNPWENSRVVDNRHTPEYNNMVVYYEQITSLINNLYNEINTEMYNAGLLENNLFTELYSSDPEVNAPRLENITFNNISFQTSSNNQDLVLRSRNQYRNANGEVRPVVPHDLLILRTLIPDTLDEVPILRRSIFGTRLEFQNALISLNILPRHIQNDPDWAFDPRRYINDTNANINSPEYYIMTADGEQIEITSENIVDLCNRMEENRNNIQDFTIYQRIGFMPGDEAELIAYLQNSRELFNNEGVMQGNMNLDLSNPSYQSIVEQYENFINEITHRYIRNYREGFRNRDDLNQIRRFTKQFANSIIIHDGDRVYRYTVHEFANAIEQGNEAILDLIERNQGNIQFGLDDPDSVAEYIYNTIPGIMEENDEYRALRTPEERAQFVSQNIRRSYNFVDRTARPINFEQLLTPSHVVNSYGESEINSNTSPKMNPLTRNQPEAFNDDPLGFYNFEEKLPKKQVNLEKYIMKSAGINPEPFTTKELEDIVIGLKQELRKQLKNPGYKGVNMDLAGNFIDQVNEYLDQYGYGRLPIHKAKSDKDNDRINFKDKEHASSFLTPKIQKNGTNIPVWDVLDKDSIAGFNIVGLDNSLENNTYSASRNTLRNNKQNISYSGENAEIVPLAENVDTEKFDIENMRFAKPEEFETILNDIHDDEGHYVIMQDADGEWENFATRSLASDFSSDISTNTKEVHYSNTSGAGLPNNNRVVALAILPWSDKAIAEGINVGNYVVCPVVSTVPNTGINDIRIILNPDGEHPGTIIIERTGSESIDTLRHTTDQFNNINDLNDHVASDGSTSIDWMQNQNSYYDNADGGRQLVQQIINRIYSIAISKTSLDTETGFDITPWLNEELGLGHGESRSVTLDEYRPSSKNMMLSRTDYELWNTFLPHIDEIDTLSNDAKTLLKHIINTMVNDYRLDPRIVLSSKGLIRVRPASGELTSNARWFLGAFENDERLIPALEELYGWMSFDPHYFHDNFDSDGRRYFNINKNGSVEPKPVDIVITTKSFGDEYNHSFISTDTDNAYGCDLSTFYETGTTPNWDSMISNLLKERGKEPEPKIDWKQNGNNEYVYIRDYNPRLHTTFTRNDLAYNVFDDYKLLHDGMNEGFYVTNEAYDPNASKKVRKKTPQFILIKDISPDTNPEVCDVLQNVMNHINNTFRRDGQHILDIRNESDKQIVMKMLAITAGWTKSTENSLVFNVDQLKRIANQLINYDLRDVNGHFGFNRNASFEENSFSLPIYRSEEIKANVKRGNETREVTRTEDRSYNDTRIKLPVYDTELHKFLSDRGIHYDDTREGAETSRAFRDQVAARYPGEAERGRRNIFATFSHAGDYLNDVYDDQLAVQYNYDYNECEDNISATYFALGEQQDPDALRNARETFTSAIDAKRTELKNKNSYLVDNPTSPDGTYGTRGTCTLKIRNENSRFNNFVRGVISQQRAMAVMSPTLAIACRADLWVGIPAKRLWLALGKRGYLPFTEAFEQRVRLRNDGRIHQWSHNDREVVAMYKLLKLLSVDDNFYRLYMLDEDARLKDMKPTDVLKLYENRVYELNKNSKEAAQAINEKWHKFENVRDKFFNACTGENAMIHGQTEIFLERLFMELGNDPNAKALLEATDTNGNRRIDNADLATTQKDEAWKLIRDLALGAEWCGDTSHAGAKALENSKLLGIAQNNLVADAVNRIWLADRPVAQLAMVTLGSRFFNATMNMTARCIDKFIPVIRPLNYKLIESILGRDEPIRILGHEWRGIGPAIVQHIEHKLGGVPNAQAESRLYRYLTEQRSREKIEAMQVYTSAKEALYSGLASWGMHALGWGLAASALMIPPSDDAKKDDYRNYSFCGIPCDIPWWITDIFAPAFIYAAFVKSWQEGEPRMQIIWNGIIELCKNNPGAKVSAFMETFFNPDKAFDKLSEEAEMFEKSNQGTPSPEEVAATNTSIFMMNQFAGLFSPLIAKDITEYLTTYEKSYKRRPKHNQSGGIDESYYKYGTTEKADYFDAQLRRMCKGNLMMGAFFSMVKQDSSYWLTNMPDVNYYEPTQRQCMQLYNVEGKSEADVKRICWEIITILNENKDMKELYRKGFYITENTKIEVKNVLKDWYDNTVAEYENVRDSGYLDFKVAGDGDYEKGKKAVAEYNKIYNQQLKNIRGIAEKLYSPDLNQGLQTYKMYNTSWREDNEGKIFASGARHNIWNYLMPFNIGPTANGTQWSGAEDDYASISKLNGKAILSDEGKAIRALVPNDKTRGNTTLENWSKTNPVSTTSSSSKTGSGTGSGSGSRSGGYRSGGSGYRSGGGGGGGRSVNIYSHAPNLNIPNAAGPRSSVYRTENQEYMRPEYYNSGSRYARKYSAL